MRCVSTASPHARTRVNHNVVVVKLLKLARVVRMVLVNVNGTAKPHTHNSDAVRENTTMASWLLAGSAQAEHPLPHPLWKPPQQRCHHRMVHCHRWHQCMAGKEATTRRRIAFLTATTVTAAAASTPSRHGHQPQ